MKFLRKAWCWIVRGHKYRVHQVFSSETRRVKCDCCGGDWAMNDREQIITPWNDEFARFYQDFGHTLREVDNA